MRRRTVRLVAAGGVMLAALVPQAPAVAEGGTHQYARGWETSDNPYSAMSVTRRDLAGADITNVVSNGCGSTDWYTGNVIYQTQWLQTSDAQDWLEFGVGHQCNNQRIYRYWGYGENGVWHSMAHNLISAGLIHEYRIVEDTTSASIWYWKLDGTTVQSAFFSQFTKFPQAVTGVESYAEFGYVKPHLYYDLAYRNDGSSTWHDWAGTDGHDDFSVFLAMCGLFVDATSWKAGETDSCS